VYAASKVPRRTRAKARVFRRRVTPNAPPDNFQTTLRQFQRYIYSQRQTKRVLRLTKHHLFIVVAFAAEVMMDDDAAVKFFV